MLPDSAKRILIAPLDWGLGHTTRCIPIIRRLLQLKCEVVFAGNDDQQTFIIRLFPGITFRSLDGYNVRYSRGALMPAIMRQLPRLAGKIRAEHNWLKAIVQKDRIDGIISDNRYGLWHPSVPSIILTHQAEIKTGLGQWADDLVRTVHYKYLRRFSGCWIVDRAGAENLGSRLSHPARLPPGARYIGWLSQLAPPAQAAKEQHLLVLLSGPEPQRTMLSDLLWGHVCEMNMPIVFVEGSASTVRTDVPGDVTHYPRVAGGQLQQLLEGASMVICRSGYSTLMDLMRLRKRAILIPTPGQTEQEYLARTLMTRKVFYTAPQKNFSLSTALDEARKFPFLLPEAEGAHTEFEAVLGEWVGQIRDRHAGLLHSD